jgi:ketosteroid isomerase-like protein
MTPADVVRAFWEAMGGNDFPAAAAWLTEDFELLWPQSGERIVGPEDFARINTAYPSHGPWRFVLGRIVAQGDTVVTDVDVTDGVVQARAVTFHRVRGRRIARQVEYWPEPFEAPAWRARWVRAPGDGDPAA